MKKKRRTIRLRVVAGTAVLVALILWMIFDENQRQQRLQVQGPPTNLAPAHAGVDPNVPFNNPNVTPPPAPQAGSVQVHVSVTKTQKQLFVDGAPIKIDGTMTLDLAPGKHLLMVQTEERTLIQKMDVHANEAQKVIFTDANVTIAPEK